MKKQILNRKQKSAALIIALLIVAFAGMIVVAAGRQIVQNNLSTTRYNDALNATTLAWAGIEDGVQRIRGSNTVGSDYYNSASAYFPLFNLPGYFNESVSAAGLNQLYKRVFRRNVTANQRSGAYVDPNGTMHIIGLNYETPLDKSCDSVYGLSMNECPLNNRDWLLSDSYYDLRVSGADDELGGTFTPIGGTATPHRTVNIDASDNIIMKSGYYNVCRNTANPSACEPAMGDGSFIDKIFDLSNYTGNLTTGGGYAGAEQQRIALKYLVNGLSATQTIAINTGVKYRDPNTTTVENENLSCYAAAPPQGGRILQNNFFAKANQATSAQNGVETFVNVPIPKPCTGDFAGNVEYLFVRFRLYPGPGATGCTNCNVSFGLRTSAFPNGSPPWWPRDDSFIGTGVYKIKSTGIYHNVRKTIEVWVAKNMHSVVDNPNGSGSFFRCDGILAESDDPNNADITNCSIRYYRQINY